VWGNKGDHNRAIADYNEAIRLNPVYTLAYRNRAMAWDAKGEIERGTADFNETIRINPKDASNYNALAWRLAVSRNDGARDGKRAIELAMQACELTSWNVANYLDTLAAAYAEAGQFPEAIRWQEKSLEFPEFVKASGTRARERLNLYRSGKPYRE
jgi:tetratricopeptide (TPR) repeat protein